MFKKRLKFKQQKENTGSERLVASDNCKQV